MRPLIFKVFTSMQEANDFLCEKPNEDDGAGSSELGVGGSQFIRQVDKNVFKISNQPIEWDCVRPVKFLTIYGTWEIKKE